MLSEQNKTNQYQPYNKTHQQETRKKRKAQSSDLLGRDDWDASPSLFRVLKLVRAIQVNLSTATECATLRADQHILEV
jgi:hypothetical protein